MRFLRPFAVATLAALVWASLASTDEDVPSVMPGNRQYSPYPAQAYPNRVYFGDTHLHTSYSTDAGMIGNTLGPEEAYRFARGETVTSSTGLTVRLPRPLDFLVVADHAESLRAGPAFVRQDPVIRETESGWILLRADVGDPHPALDHVRQGSPLAARSARYTSR